MPWVGTDWGCPFHHGSLQCVPLALQTDQWSELTKALQEQVEVKKVLWPGGMGARHVCEVKAPSERAWHGLLTGPFAFPAAQEQAPAPPGETGMPARAKSFQGEEGAGRTTRGVAAAGDGGRAAGRTDKPAVGLGEGRVCSVPEEHEGTGLSGDEGGALSPQTSAPSHTPTHVPAVPWPVGGAAGVKEAWHHFLAEETSSVPRLPPDRHPHRGCAEGRHP
ncbi:uncharacterized protein LOC129200918 isoform X1 [Grus americana]|uniref:uncharacterized protein LOC129198193 isoform X1 n=1 Tax=Grus americana TaxID=9117 RepID=UPI0024082C41|nr:uncharacterized protein LOC129198193 isoform X1 [Grus americana]XP_054667696.1 uncharacterized protein LOC129200378 isoform X1 [Grus americana]XP_054668142.1 uncharacterized protein LOC129200918 isoform X1 [Grus americana]